MTSGRTRLAQALEGLGRSERLVLALARLERLEPAEIAVVLGTSEEQAARALRHAESALERGLAAADRVLRATPGPRHIPARAAQAQKERSRWRA